jgi:hypothetical protein
MIVHVVFRNPEIIVPENGPSTALYLEVRDNCREAIYVCLERQMGSWDRGMAVALGAVLETIVTKGPEYLVNVLQKTSDYLSLTGQQYAPGAELPSAVQCRTADEQVDAWTHASFTSRGFGWALTNFPEERFEELRELARIIRKVMCPSLPHVPLAKDVVDSIAFRYRSLGRPRPFLWYGALLLLAVVLPWARRLLPVILTAGAIILNHAVIAGIISNVQPRYVVVVNPLRAVLLGFLFYIAVQLAARILNRAFRPRSLRREEPV